jgi:deoxycytidylate deaminase
MLINAGVKRIVYAEGYPDRLGLEMLQQANVKVEEYSSL